MVSKLVHSIEWRAAGSLAACSRQRSRHELLRRLVAEDKDGRDETTGSTHVERGENNKTERENSSEDPTERSRGRRKSRTPVSI